MRKFKSQLIKISRVFLFCLVPALLGCGEGSEPFIKLYLKINGSGLEKVMILTEDDSLALGYDSLTRANRFSMFNDQMSKINLFALDAEIIEVFRLFIFSHDHAPEIEEKIFNIFIENKEKESAADGESKKNQLREGINTSLFQVIVDLNRFMSQITSVDLEVGNKKYPFNRTGENGVWQIDLRSILKNKAIQHFVSQVVQSPEFAKVSTLDDLIKTIMNSEYSIPLVYLNVSYNQW